MLLDQFKMSEAVLVRAAHCFVVLKKKILADRQHRGVWICPSSSIPILSHSRDENTKKSYLDAFRMQAPVANIQVWLVDILTRNWGQLGVVAPGRGSLRRISP